MEVQSPAYISNNVFVELGLIDLSDERKIALLDQMNTLVHKRVLLQLVDLLPDTATATLESVADADDETMMEKLTELVPNLPEVIIQEVDAVKADMREVISETTG